MGIHRIFEKEWGDVGRIAGAARWAASRNPANPLVAELCFWSIFEMYIKIDSYRLPTHRRDAHRIFFNYPLLF